MKITGQILKENREKKGISISEVAIATKINNRTLQAMEEGDLDNLPPKTFLRGFVRAYAGYLELDVESVLSNFYEEMGSTKPKPPPPPSEGGSASARPTPKKEADEAINPKASLLVKVGAVAGILLLVVMIVFFKKKMESYENEAVVEGVPTEITAIEPKEDEAAPPAASATPEETATPSPSLSPTPSVSAVAPVATPSPSPSATPSATATPSPTPEIKATPTPKPSPTATPTPAPTPTPKPSPSPTATPAAAAVAASPSPSPKPVGRQQEVLIEALDAVEVDAQIDDEPMKKLRLKGDQVQSIKARRKVVLRFSDGGAVNLIVNGVERGVPGDLGKPLRVELP